MPFKPFERLTGGGMLLDQIQDRLESTFRDNIESSILDGNTVEVALTGSPVTVQHKLGKTPAGWVIVDIADLSGALDVYRTAWTKDTITLTSTVTATLKVLVF